MFGPVMKTGDFFNPNGGTPEYLFLRPVPEDAAAPFARWFSDPEITRWLSSMPDGCTEEFEREWIKKAATDSTLYVWGIYVGEKIVGNCTLNKIDWTARTAVGGMVIGDKEFWGKGFATGAARAMLHFAFEQLNLRTVYALVYEPNKRSLEHIQRVGFKQYGIQPDAIFANGQYYGAWEGYVTESLLQKAEEAEEKKG